jgi:hypothetical protein
MILFNGAASEDCCDAAIPPTAFPALLVCAKKDAAPLCSLRKRI